MRGFHAECLVLRRGDSTRGLRSAGASDVGLSEKCKVGSRLFYTISRLMWNAHCCTHSETIFIAEFGQVSHMFCGLESCGKA